MISLLDRDKYFEFVAEKIHWRACIKDRVSYCVLLRVSLDCMSARLCRAAESSAWISEITVKRSLMWLFLG